MQIYYVNGSFTNKNRANISVEDRGFNFSDGIYELIAFMNKKLIFFDEHSQRLFSSLNSLNIPFPYKNLKSLKLIIAKLISLNKILNGYVYIQITRGTDKRNHVFSNEITPNIVIFILPIRKIKNLQAGIKVRTSQDLRWKRCDIKSISLLPNILEKQLANNTGFYETWQVKNKFITEGTTSNAFIVDKNKAIRTHPKSNLILGGVTRDIIIQIAKQNKIKVLEKKFSINDIKYCSEAFLTSTTVRVLPVVKVDNLTINNSKIGSLTNFLIEEINKKIFNV